ncbi:uncharacterized protein LOC114543796 [Dendronephthya gigantea]|uniref:uncharacterized protein LOC114543796 n=1 Tax=Dendronephthya gigantea TaxID=151771 RepID=UPI00106A8D08|nr:uncharacterized protein LOC114543796 [Dendronephthya gigantea]
MYCPVYGCTSDYKKNKENNIHYFSFPKASNKEEQRRRNIWIDFCKRKNFRPSKCTCMCSLHFATDSYVPSHSPDFLKSINFFGKRKLILKPDAVPTIRKALDSDTNKEEASAKKKRSTGILSRRKEVDELIAHAESFAGKADEGESEGTILESSVSASASETCQPEARELKKHSSVSVQTIRLEYVGKNAGTQTSRKLEGTKLTCVTKGTQTFVSNEFFTRLESLKKASTSSQTDPIECDSSNAIVSEEIRKVEDDGHSLNDKKLAVTVDLDKNNIENSDHVKDDHDENDAGDDSCDEEFLPTSGEESESDEEHIEDTKTCDSVILTSDKPIQDQLKLIICEESIATMFSVCFKCGSRCTVSVGNTIGSYCTIYISCCSSANHEITWSTGPLLNRLPAMNLLMASTILSTGMECNKTLRFMESLKILCFKRREFSNVQGAYVIPAVVSVWRTEQRKLLSEIDGKSIEIASDMRVDSPGHSGLLGAGSSLDQIEMSFSILK